MKILSRTILLAVSIMTACSISPIAIAAQDQGTITATFDNDCHGYRQIGINAAVNLVNNMNPIGTEYNLNVPEKYNDPWKKLWLNCGQKVNRTLKYDIKYFDFNIESLLVIVSYRDNMGDNKQDIDGKNYNFPADGAHCTIRYSGTYPPVEDISCVAK